jgi:AcrR family transcriptional regulator
MARTQAADYEERREAIVDHAARLFAKSGFLGASIIDLANACQTSKSLIYHYYPSKEDILYAVMSSHLDQLTQDMAEVQAMAGGPEARLSALVHRFMAHYVGAADRQKVLLNDLDNLPPDKRAEIVRKQRRIIDYVRDLLVQITPDLDKAKGQAQVQTMLLFGMINWTHTWFDPEGPVSASEVADMAIRLIAPST